MIEEHNTNFFVHEVKATAKPPPIFHIPGRPALGKSVVVGVAHGLNQGSNQLTAGQCIHRYEALLYNIYKLVGELRFNLVRSYEWQKNWPVYTRSRGRYSVSISDV